VSDRELYGAPEGPAALALSFVTDRIRHGRIGKYIWESRRIPSWTRGEEAVALARTSYGLGEGAVIVEIGSFLGGSAVLLAGPRKERGSGKVHCVDPFDGSGDAFSAPIYRDILRAQAISPRQWFERNIARAGLAPWVAIEAGRSEEVAPRWTQPIDFLVVDGDQSYEGVKSACDAWLAFLKPGAIVALHNARPGYRKESHDGHARVGEAMAAGSGFRDVRYAGSLMLARKAS
jgi:predicted O-methyltransferase YrrM